MHLEYSALAITLAEIGSILLVSRVMTLLIRPLRQPAVIAEMLAGIVLGPSVLGWLWPELSELLFQSASLGHLRLLSQVGLVLFMFLVGLELDPTLFRGRAHAVVLISHTGIIVPFALGAVVAWWLWPRYSAPAVPLSSFMAFFGVALSVTAFPVLARILTERQLLGSRMGKIAMACAAVDDVTAWCLLAGVVALARARQLSDGLWTAALACGFVLAMLYGVRPLLGRWMARVDVHAELAPSLLPGFFMLIIGSSAVTELIGIHALFGAFCLGAIMPKRSGLPRLLAAKLESVSVVLLLPLFFAYSGLRTQIGLLAGPEQWLVAGAIILVATLGKLGGGALAARAVGLCWREAGAIGILMNTRGLMELIVLNTGMDLGIISPTIFTMLVLMALVTTCATTPLLAWIYPARRLREESALEAAPLGAGLGAP